MVLQLLFPTVQVFEASPGTFQVVCPKAGTVPREIRDITMKTKHGIFSFLIFIAIPSMMFYLPL
jgi:hypothetical protein